MQKLRTCVRASFFQGFAAPGRLLGLFALLAGAAMAQYTSGIEGTVLDQSGAPVPNAVVSVTNQATQVSRQLTGNASGFFRATQLPPGPYTVNVKMSGFQDWVQAGIQVNANVLQTVYPRLSVGQQTARVEVNAQASPIETGRSSVARTVPQSTITESPMVGRNVYGGVAFLAPGVTGAGQSFGGATGSGSAGQDSFQTESGFQINAAGQRQEANEYDVDGSSVNGNSRDGIANLTPEPDTVQEARVAAVTFSAEKGRESGALVEIYTKSGTNQIHGTLSEFHSDNDLTARSIFQNTVPVYRRNEYGFTLGGPVIKNRTFLFGSFFRLNSAAASTDVATVETPQFLQFLQSNYPNNISTKLLTNAPPGNYPTTGFITASQLAKSSYYPVPAALPGSLPVVGTAYINQTLARPAQQWNTRLDQYLRQDKDRIFFNYYNFYSKAQADNPRPVERITQPNNGMFGKVDWSTTISPSLVNDASMTLNRVDGRTPQTSQPEFPSVNVTGFNGFSQSNIAWAHVNYNWHDVLSLLRGNHSIKIGADIDRQHDLDNFSPSYVRPTFTFANVLDLAQDLPISQTGPILQTSNGQLAQNLYKRINMLYVGGFIQDDWKVKRNLTLNVGLRYDYFGHLAQMDNGGVPTSFFTLGNGTSFAEQMANGFMRTTAGGFVSAGAPWGVTPRIGFGWDVFGNGSLAVRGGYAIFQDRVGDLSYASNANGNPPTFGQVVADVRQGQHINYSLGSANGLYFPPPPGVVFTPNAAGGFSNVHVRVSGVDEYPTAPHVQVWNLTLEKTLGKSIVIEADYLGNHANNLYLQTDVNRFAGDLSINNGRLTRLTSNFGPVIYGRFQGIDDAHYGTFLINKRFTNGFSLEAMYTFGKSTDYTSSNDNGTPNGETVFDAANFQGQHARSDYSVAKRFTFDSVYDVPSIWKNGWKSKVVGGWRLAAISIFQSGLPFSVITTAPYPTGDYNADGYAYDAPNTPSFGNHISSSNGNFVSGLFSPAAFPRPAAGHEGNLGRNTFDGPGLANVNLNVIKSFKLPWFFSEQATLELRGEIFNLLNRTNLTNPVNDLSSPLFGKSVGQNLPRSVTFGARIQF